MSNSLQETNVEEIAKELTARRDQGQRTTLFLGSRTGGLYGNEYLYDTLKQFSLLNFDSLSNIDKFRECYYVLSKRFKEMERRDILVGTLATLRYREEDKLLAELIRTGLFETVITTNIDGLLEEACSLSGNHIQTIIPGVGDISAIEQNNYRHNAIVKVFGDLESLRYYIADEAFNLEDRFRGFLQSKLSNDILIVGYDSVWDHEIERIFPPTGGTVWYVSETEPPQHTYLESLLKQRSGKSLLKRRGNYSSFVRALCNDLEEEIHRNQGVTAPLPFLSQEPVKDTKKVVISYSQKDKNFLDRMTTHLKGYLYLLKGFSQLKDTVDFWDDTKIPPDANWQEEIEKALAQAVVVVLLISANYLSSKDVNAKELPFLLDAARNGKVKLLPIILDQSPLLSGEYEPLNDLNHYLVVNSSSRPFKKMDSYEQEVVWDKLAEQVYGILQAQK